MLVLSIVFCVGEVIQILVDKITNSIKLAFTASASEHSIAFNEESMTLWQNYASVVGKHVCCKELKNRTCKEMQENPAHYTFYSHTCNHNYSFIFY